MSDLATREVVRVSEPMRRGAPGRPSPLVSPRGDRILVLALELSVDSLAAALVGIGGEVLDRHRVRRDRAYSDPEDVVAAAADLAQPLLDGLSRRQRLLAVGVSVVGVVRSSDGFVHVAPNLGWRDVAIAGMVRSALRRRTPVVVGNDGDLGALAEHVRGAGIAVDDLLYLSGEVGIGAGVVMGGRPMSGAAGYAGEVGHMVVNLGGHVCSCGATGCWETEAGEPALLRRAGLPEDGGLTGVDQVLEAVEAGDVRARRAVDETACWLGLGIGGLINAYNPQRVVLGSFFSTLHRHAGAVIVAAARRQALAAAVDTVDIVVPALGVDAPLVGAAELAFAAALADPTTLPVRGARRHDVARAE